MRPEILLAVSIDAVGVARLPQVLAAAGCQVTVMSCRGLAIAASRFVSKHIVTGASTAEVRNAPLSDTRSSPRIFTPGC